MLSDEILIAHLHKGDEMAFKELFCKYYLPLCSFAYQYVKDDGVTDDFVQDAFFCVWEKRKNFLVLPAVKSFLYLSVKNACLNWLKHQKVVGRNEAEVAHILYTEEDEDKIRQEEIYAQIYEIIKDFSPQTRKIILMSMEGLSNPEIAARMGISQNTVKTIKLRAYRTLRKKLENPRLLLFFIFLLD